MENSLKLSEKEHLELGYYQEVESADKQRKGFLCS